MLAFLKDKKTYFIVGILVVAIGGGVAAYGYFNNQNAKKFQSFNVEPVQLGETVEATGFLQPATSVNLAFHTSGEVSKVFVDVGQRVKTGDLLASLSNDSQKATLAQSKGVLAEDQAALNLELANATNQDIAIARSGVDGATADKNKAQVDYNNALIDLDNTRKTVDQDSQTAELSLQNAKLNLQKVLSTGSSSTQQSGSTVDNAVVADKTAINQFLVSTKNLLQNTDKVFGIQGPSIFTVQEKSLASTTISSYSTTLDEYTKNFRDYNDLNTKFNALSANPSSADLISLDNDITELSNNLNSGTLDVTLLLNKAISEFNDSNITSLRDDITAEATAVNSSSAAYESAKTNLDNAGINNGNTLNTTPLDVQSAQLAVNQQTQNVAKVQVNGETEISSKETAVKSLQAEITIADSEVTKANAELDKVLASPRAVDVAPYRARLQQAQAGVAQAQSAYDDTLITAPFDGIITAKNIDLGDQFLVASGISNSPALGIIDDSQFHIDVNIPETEVTKISTDSKTSVTFDALGTDQTFDAKILSIEPASTTVQDIIYYKAKIALVKNDPSLKAGMTANVSIEANSSTPVLAIPEKAITTDENNQKTVMISADKTLIVMTGVRGDNGMIEIVSGLKEGDRILVPTN